MGSLFSYIFSPNPSAGASGAIFGAYGIPIVFQTEKKGYLSPGIWTQIIYDHSD
ncbi:MAG: rhomboid family intramembrane serine protease [Caldicoprobacterales bacterium]